MIQYISALIIIVFLYNNDLIYVYIYCFSGFPWDWQSGNAKFPVYNGYPTNHRLHEQQLHNQRQLHPPVRLLNINTNVTAVVGETAHLPCRAKDLGEYTVSDILRTFLSNNLLSQTHLN